MRAIPAIDLRDGHCVQLVGGDYANEAVRLNDPVRVAQRWIESGFSRLHIVDLDAATSRGNNRALMRRLIDCGVPVQVGGGVRTAEDVESLIRDGADHVIVGTRGVEDPAWLAMQSRRYPSRLVLAADVRGRTVLTRGWADASTRDILDLIRELEELPLAGLLVTAVNVEGTMQGADLELMRDVVAASSWPVIASGGVGSLGDLRALERLGVSAVVLGMALYTGALDARAVAEEFSQ
jgi:phosphoribosylformimino-5-aminoimidazole carboxamide ribotide isomerase